MGQWDNWRNGGQPVTDPDAFDADGKPHHEYCTWCGKVTRGPHAGQRWPTDIEHKVEAADDARTYTAAEAAEAGKLHNVGGSICPSCYDAWVEKGRAQIAERKRQRGETA